MNREEALEVVRADLARPGAVSWLDGREQWGRWAWRARCGAPGCGWVCQAPARCPIHDEAHCYHHDGDPRDLIDVGPPRPMVEHWHDKQEQAQRCLNRHLVKEHGWKREELGR